MAPFALTIFASAFLLFLVQPLSGRYILPWFGGTPAVWTSCLLFFQVLLLAGYAYAHATSDWLKPRVQASVHLLLLLASLAMLSVLPIIPSSSWKPSGDESPPWRIMALLAVTIGTPYFVLSTTGPLIQRWFGHAHPGRSPYRLYALSNVGSLLALVSYPFVVEPALTLGRQAHSWSWAYAAFVLACGWCAALAFRPGRNAESSSSQLEERTPRPSPDPSLKGRGVETGPSLRGRGIEGDTRNPKPATQNPEPRTRNPQSSESQRPSWIDLAMWLLLATCGSAMLLATNNQMCQDMPSVPFLWVLPLALYLLSFVICFDSPRWYLRSVFVPLLAVSAAAAAAVLYVGVGVNADQQWVRDKLAWLSDHGIHIEMAWLESVVDTLAKLGVQIAIYALALFACAMACHGELTRSKPHPRYLTLFYLVVAAGGALGGILVALVAPRVFDGFSEYHVGLAATFALVMIAMARDRTGWMSSGKSWWAWAPMLLGFAALTSVLYIQPEYGQKDTIYQSRNFFGVLRVKRLDADPNAPSRDPNGESLSLTHGRILHGFQYQDPDKRNWPTTYYSYDSGVGVAIRLHPKRAANWSAPKPMRIGVVGLGTGTIASYGQKDDYLRFYEINPEVLKLSGTGGEFFTYVRDTPARKDIVLGDARVQMERELERGARQNLDVLAVDAFSSDAIPMHLLTRECFEIYAQHLAEGGILAIHISNRYFDLSSVVRGAAAELGFEALQVSAEDEDSQGASASTWVLVTRNRAFIQSKSVQEKVTPWIDEGDHRDPPPIMWTDDFASLRQVLK